LQATKAIQQPEGSSRRFWAEEEEHIDTFGRLLVGMIPLSDPEILMPEQFSFTFFFCYKMHDCSLAGSA